MPIPPSKRPGLATTAGDHETRIRALERRPPGTWVYVGTFPTDPDTTVDSPPFENGWTNVGGGAQRLRFRRTNENTTDVEGNITGGTTGTVVTTLPDAIYIPQEDQDDIGLFDGSPCKWTLNTDGELVFDEIECCGLTEIPTAREIPFDPTTDIPVTNVQDAIEEVKAELLAFMAAIDGGSP